MIRLADQHFAQLHTIIGNIVQFSIGLDCIQHVLEHVLSGLKKEGVSARIMYIKFYKILTCAIIILFPLFLLVEDRYSIDGFIMSFFLCLFNLHGVVFCASS